MENNGDSDLDNEIRDANAVHIEAKHAADFEGEDISDSKNDDANSVSAHKAEPETDLPASTLRQASFNEKSPTEIFGAPRRSDEGDEEFQQTCGTGI